MGVEPFLVASAVQGVLAQRLVRSICQSCVQQYIPDKKLVQVISGVQNGNSDIEFVKGKGCDHCKGTGYKGRNGVYELLSMDDDLRQMVLDRKSNTEIALEAQKRGMKSILQDGLEKVEKHVTTIEEVFRVTQV